MMCSYLVKAYMVKATLVACARIYWS